MKPYMNRFTLIIIYICFASKVFSQIQFTTVPPIGDFFVAPLHQTNKAPLKINYREDYNVYYPSPIFDIDRYEYEFIVYNLHSVYLDSCSFPRLKTFQVRIPKEFKGVRCRVGSSELTYSFQTKKCEILVYIPAVEKGTLNNYECSLLYSFSQDQSNLYESIKMLPISYKIKENRYIGVKQTHSYAIYYYNFNKKLKKKFERATLLSI